MSKILIIEDDRKIRAILKEILEEKDHEVDEAADGEEGYRKLEQGSFDLCLCDIKMPKMDGLEVLEKSKEAGIGANFVIISAHGTIDVAAVTATNNGRDARATSRDGGQRFAAFAASMSLRNCPV